MEQWNAYTQKGELTETILIRGEAIPRGFYHLVCEVLVQHIDGSILCMKRDYTKQAYPGYFEATAGGAALLGESPLQCVQRELYEETGIFCEEYKEVAYHVFEESQCIYYSFLCITDCDKKLVRLQPGETIAYRWMPENEFAAFVQSDKMIENQKYRYRKYFSEKGYYIEEEK